MREWLRNVFQNIINMKTVRKRMIVSQVSVILIVVLLMGVSIYSFTCRLLTERNQELYTKILNASEKILNDNLSHYTEIARLFLENDTIQETLLNSEDSGDDIFMSNNTFSILERYGRSYANGVDNINSIYVFDNAGKLFYLDQNKQSNEVNSHIDYNTLQGEIWFQSALEARGSEVYLGYDVIWNSDESFSCVKVLNSLKGNEKIGVLVLNIKKDVLKNVFSFASEDRDIYAVFYEEQGKSQVIYEKGYSQEIFGLSIDQMLENEKGSYEVTRLQCSAPGWLLVHVIGQDAVFGEADTIQMIIAAIGCVAVLAMILLTVLQAFQITKPLYQLKDSIHRVGQGERSFENTFKNDEIGMIGQEFQNMVKEKIELKEKITEEKLLRRESELQLLQSQINPHFLYNTLDTLYWMAIEEEVEGIARLTESLSEIFRLSLNNGKEMNTIREEIKFIEDYLYIQNIRFEGRFLVQIKMEEQILDWKIIKLILQPFIENAIYHGLEPKMGNGLLSVTGNIENNFLVFSIQDNGVGMDEPSKINSGYGITNVMERIKMSYGKKARIIFDSKKSIGTTVKLYLPAGEVKYVGSHNS